MSSFHPTDRIEQLSLPKRKCLPGFRSFKTPEPIFYPARWHHDLLVQLTLDTQVAKICLDEEHEHERDFRLNIYCSENSQKLVAIPDDRLSMYIALGDNLIVNRSVVLSEPSLSNSRAIWSTRNLRISPGDRLRVLEQLNAHSEGLEISQLTDCIQNSAADPLDAILALACFGICALDTSFPLSPFTIIRIDRNPHDAGVRQPVGRNEQSGSLMARIRAIGKATPLSEGDEKRKVSPLERP